MEFLDQTGVVVGRSTLPVEYTADTQNPGLSFTVFIEKPTLPFSSLRIVQNGNSLAEKRLVQSSTTSQATPEVLILKDGILLRWGAPSIPAIVRYTTDKGNTWTALAVDWLGGEFYIDPAGLPKGLIEFEIIQADNTASTISTTWENQLP